MQELFCDTGIVVFVKLLALLLVANCSSPEPKVRGWVLKTSDPYSPFQLFSHTSKLGSKSGELDPPLFLHGLARETS